MSQENDCDEFTVVPILSEFNSADPIGELKIRTSALPEVPDFVFSLAIQALQTAGQAGEIPRRQYLGPYKLFAVAIVPNDNYIGYLRQVGKL